MRRSRTVMEDTLGEQRFRFRSGNASIQGGIGAAALVGGALTWATLTGRIHEPSLTYFAGWILGALVMAALLWRGHRASVRHAQSLGHIEIDERGLRWIRSDGATAAELEWAQVEQAAVEARTSTVAIVVRGDDADAPRTATLFGDPSGGVRFEDFDGFTEALRRHCALKDSATTTRAQRHRLTKTLWVWAAVFAAIGVALFWINGSIERATAARHVFPLIPLAFGFLALVYALAAVTFGRGAAPMVSQLYNPRFLARQVPMTCVFLVLANFALLWLLP